MYRNDADRDFNEMEAAQRDKPSPVEGLGSARFHGHYRQAQNGRNVPRETASRMPSVIEADRRLFEGLNLLSDNIGELEERLRDVLRPGLAEPAGGGCAAPGPLGAPLAERLGNAADRVSSLAMQVRSILGRLEV